MPRAVNAAIHARLRLARLGARMSRSRSRPDCKDPQGTRKWAAAARFLRYVALVTRIGVLASGSGTILHALLHADLPIVVVLVDRECGATEIARAAGAPVEIVQRKSFGRDFDRVAYTHEVVDALARHDVD